MPPISEWEAERLGDLVRLTDAGLPGEHLSADELLACCWDDPGVVLGADDGSGAVAAVVRSFGEVRIGWTKLVVVDEDARRDGRGDALLAAAEGWMFDQGAVEVQLGGAAPFYLWPGVDVTMLGMLCLAEARGYQPSGSEINMSLASTFRAPPPTGVTIRRVLDDVDATHVRSFVEPHWPSWIAETQRGIDQGGCHGAWGPAGECVGFACHSVNRAGWVGPMGTAPDGRARGVGHALLGELCRDAMTAMFDEVEISWVGPVRFYAKAGASVSRSFRSFRKPRP